MLRALHETLFGLFHLARLAFRTGFRFRGAYWSWRMQTAFGRGYPASRWELVKSILAYGRWMHQTQRMRS